MAKVRIVSLTLTALIVGVCIFAPVIHGEKLMNQSGGQR